MADWQDTLCKINSAGMNHTTRELSSFSRAITTQSHCLRADHEFQIEALCAKNYPKGLLARGSGLSYNDCCLLNEGHVIDTHRLNHFISFDSASGLVVCQGAVTFADLFCLSDEFSPPVLPGTLHATLAGGIANDIHGKNNVSSGTFGHHIEWIELQVGDQIQRCSARKNAELFFATLAGLGLTGFIKRVALTLHKTPPFVTQSTEKHTDLGELLQRMQHHGQHQDYQVAWLDLLNTPRALLSFATHESPPAFMKQNTRQPTQAYRVPALPMRLVTHHSMKAFNQLYYHSAKTTPRHMPLWQFNNPLDCIRDWNNLYGKAGLLQFQAVFDQESAEETILNLLSIIKKHTATPTLSVLKYFTQPGAGLLSFVQPGFTLAIDFIHNRHALAAMSELNQFITDIGGRVYLAKDTLLTADQFLQMYPNAPQFKEVLKRYNSPMTSDLAKRIKLR